MTAAYILSSVFTLIYFYVFLFNLYKIKKNRLPWLILGSLIFVAANIFVLPYIKIPFLNAVISILYLLITTRIFFIYEIGSYILNTFIYMVYLIFADLITTVLFSLFISVDLNASVSNPFPYLISTLLNAILVFSTYNIILALLKKYILNTIGYLQIIFMFLLFLFEMGLLNYIDSIIKNESHGLSLIIISVCFLFLDIGVLYLFRLILRYTETDKRLSLAEQQIKNTSKYYESLKEKYLLSRQMKHDVNRHLSIIEGLIKNNDKESIGSYMDSLNRELDKLSVEFLCDNKILSVLISDKLTTCKAKEIDFNVKIQNINMDFMEDIDITILFSNIIDNAIDACAAINDPSNKCISLNLTQYKEWILINIRNPYKNIKLSASGKLLSNKQNHYGIGLSNVSSVVNKYSGSIDYDTADGQFVLQITLPL